MEKDMPDPEHKQRRSERRVSTSIEPPPYETGDGTVLSDRRMSCDRRAFWIREFSLETPPAQES